MAFVKRRPDGQQVEAPVRGIIIDEASTHRLRCAIMLAMCDKGWSYHWIGMLFRVDRRRIHEHLTAMPEEAKAFYRGVVEDLVGDLLKVPPSHRRRGKPPSRRTKAAKHPWREKPKPPKLKPPDRRRAPYPLNLPMVVRKSLTDRHAEAEARIDARCLAAVERLGDPVKAARWLKITLGRVKAAVERKEASAWRS